MGFKKAKQIKAKHKNVSRLEYVLFNKLLVFLPTNPQTLGNQMTSVPDFKLMIPKLTHPSPIHLFKNMC